LRFEGVGRSPPYLPCIYCNARTFLTKYACQPDRTLKTLQGLKHPRFVFVGRQQEVNDTKTLRFD